MRVAAYQAPLLRPGSVEALALIRERVNWCEAEGIAMLCCPEAILGGLADDALDPAEFAIDARGDELARTLAPLASDTVTTIVGFTEIADTGRLYNSAAVFHKGTVLAGPASLPGTVGARRCQCPRNLLCHPRPVGRRRTFHRAPVGRTVDAIARCCSSSLSGPATRSIMLRLQPLLDKSGSLKLNLKPANNSAAAMSPEPVAQRG